MSDLTGPIDPTVQPFVGMDIYLLDQLMRGRVAPGARVLDVGAGAGRNLRWFLERGHPCVAVEPNREAAEALLEGLAARRLHLAEDDLIRKAVEVADVPSGAFDLVICVAVLHFAAEHRRFDAIVQAAWDALAPGGVLFVRLATTIGIEDQVRPLGEGRYVLPDGSERYLADEERLLRMTERLGALPLDPLKTTIVQGLRAMTTWVLGKPPR